MLTWLFSKVFLNLVVKLLKSLNWFIIVGHCIYKHKLSKNVYLSIRIFFQYLMNYMNYMNWTMNLWFTFYEALFGSTIEFVFTSVNPKIVLLLWSRWKVCNIFKNHLLIWLIVQFFWKYHFVEYKFCQSFTTDK